MNSTGTKVRILIVDDRMLFRESIARLLNAEADFDVVADCGTIADAMRVMAKSAVDLVLLDFDLGQQTGFHFFSEIRRIGFQGKVLIVTGPGSAKEKERNSCSTAPRESL
jgi:DNA-binding NarL/FixJ family response regulator